MKVSATTVLCLVMAMGVAQAEEWVDISETLRPLVPRSNWDTGSWCGTEGIGAIYLDAEGKLFAKVNGNGVYATENQGEQWERADSGTVSGRNWGGLSIYPDRLTGRFAVFAVQGYSAITLDGGVTWRRFTRPSEYDTMRHDGWTYGAGDWSADTPKVFIAKQHETTNLWLSTDGGQRWTPLGVRSWHVGMADSAVLLYGDNAGIKRSADTGKTWETVSTYIVRGSTPVRYGGRLYWTAEEGLLYSDDRGLSWEVLFDGVELPLYGPYFGADDSEMVILGADGFYRTTDRGDTWTWLAAYQGFLTTDGCGDSSFNVDNRFALGFYGWDYRRQILYGANNTSWVHMLRLGESSTPTMAASPSASGRSMSGPLRRVRMGYGAPIDKKAHSLAGRRMTSPAPANQVTIEKKR